MCPIRLYAGSIKSGGGKTVVAVVTGRLQRLSSNSIIVYVGDRVIATELSSIYPEVDFKVFGSNMPSVLRTIWAKFYFSIASLFWNKNSIVISVNFWLPVRCKLATYHVNLLNFETNATFSLGSTLRRLDAHTACLRSDLNMFESKYLLDVASTKIQKKPVNSVIQYLGFNPVFLNKKARATQPGTIVMVSSIQPHKNNECSLLALKQLIDEYSDIKWKLVVFGGQSKTDWNGFIEDAKKFKLYDQVKIMGPHPQQHIAEFITTASVVVSCSLVESFCMVALEAMASGCPAIVTNLTSMPESVGPAGIIIPPNDPIRLAEAIYRVNTDLRYREEIVGAGYQHISNFEEDKLTIALKNSLRLLDYPH